MQEMTLLSRDPLTYALAGELDSGNCDEFYREVMDHYTGGAVILDCAKLEFIDSTMLGTLVKLHRQAEGKGGKLTIRHLPPRLKKLFVICALDKVLEIEP